LALPIRTTSRKRQSFTLKTIAQTGRKKPAKAGTPNNMPHRIRKNIHPGLRVAIVLKQNQRTGKQTIGVVKDLLTNSPSHPHGIKVRLTDGQVGRVKEILD